MQITTPSGHDVVVKDYLTFRDVQALKRMTYSGIKLDTDTGKPKDISGAFIADEEQAILELLVVSVKLSGSDKVVTDKPFELVLDMSGEDGEVVLEACRQVRNTKKKTASN